MKNNVCHGLLQESSEVSNLEKLSGQTIPRFSISFRGGNDSKSPIKIQLTIRGKNLDRLANSFPEMDLLSHPWSLCF